MAKDQSPLCPDPRQSGSGWLGDAVDRLEHAWRTVGAADLAEFIPAQGDPQRLRFLEALIPIDQEYRWKAGERKAVEAYRDQWQELDDAPATLARLLEAECLLRVRCGEAFDRADLEQRFRPSVISQVNWPALLAEIDEVARGGAGTQSWGIPCRRDVIAACKSAGDLPLAIGMRLNDRYEVQKLLGRGAEGTVYRVWDPVLQRSVAVKSPTKAFLRLKGGAERFLDEARAAASLRHPGIVQIYEFLQLENDRCFVIMEDVEGGSLKDLLKSGPLSARRAAELTVAMAKAIAYAHGHQLVHRDLKPANVLLDADGQPRIADFGLALREEVRWSHAGEIAGTPQYMAPEQVRGDSHRLDGRTDVWALGVMLYQMLTGVAPFAGDHWKQVSDEILHREPKPLRERVETIPAALEAICLKCLVKDVAGRYRTANDLARDLRGWLYPRRRFLVAASVTAAVAMGLAALLLPQFFRPDVSPQASPASLSGTLDVLVWNSEDTARRGLSVKNAGALPLRAKDKIRVEARLSRPAYVYLLWIDSQGIAQPVYPWTPGDWAQRPSPESLTDRVNLPARADEGWPMEGPPGMETLMLFARESPLPDDVDLARLLTDLPRQEAKNSQALVWFVGGQPTTNAADRERRPKFFDPQQIDDPVLKAQRIIQERLGSHFAINVAVSFASQPN